jgi:hypothetical protein
MVLHGEHELAALADFREVGIRVRAIGDFGTIAPPPPEETWCAQVNSSRMR